MHRDGTTRPLRVFHVSDTHLGYASYRKTDASGVNQREQDVYATWRVFIERCLAERPDAVVHSGDLFDSVRPGNRALGECLEGFSRLAHAGIPAVVISGNHESPKLRETGSVFRILDHLEGVRAVYRGRLETHTLDTAAGRLHVHAVPQAADGDELAEQLAAARPRPDGFNVLTVHGAVTTIPDFHNTEFNEQILPTGLLDARHDYVALGHFHRHAQVLPNAFYAGSIAPFSFGETGERKGFVQAHLEGRPLASRPDAASGSTLTALHEELPHRRVVDLPPLVASTLAPRGDVLAPSVLLAAAGRHLASFDLAEALARLKVLEVPPETYRGLDFRALESLAPAAFHLHLVLERLAEPGGVRESARLGPLPDEFRRFLAEVPLPRVPRERLLELGLRYLDGARQESEGREEEEEGRAAEVPTTARAPGAGRPAATTLPGGGEAA